MAEFFAMGGYAAFVWPSYAVTILALIGILYTSLRALRTAERRAALFDAANPRRARRAARESERS